MKKSTVGPTVFGDNPLRLHDDIYLTAPPTTEKSSYVQAEKLLRDFVLTNPSAKVADIGCATGDFTAYLLNKHPALDVTGFDIHDGLVAEARKRYPETSFKVGSLLDSELIEKNSQDIVTVLGVLPIFDEIEPLFSNISQWLRPGGLMLVLSLFNPFPIDTWMRFERWDANNGKEVGWNIASQAKVSHLLTTLGAQNIQFTKLVVDFTLEKNADDPMRTWTSEMDGENVAVNGSWIVHPLYFMKALKSD